MDGYVRAQRRKLNARLPAEKSREDEREIHSSSFRNIYLRDATVLGI